MADAPPYTRWPEPPRGLHTLERMRLLTEVESPDGCWLWHGILTKTGVPTIGSHSTKAHVHRYLFRLTQPLRHNQALDRLCPVGHCVNPAHHATRPPSRRSYDQSFPRQPWTEQDLSTLRSMLTQGRTVIEVARAIHRGTEAVRIKAKAEGLPTTLRKPSVLVPLTCSDCGEVVERTGTNQKRCPTCRFLKGSEQKLAYSRSAEGLTRAHERYDTPEKRQAANARNQAWRDGNREAFAMYHRQWRAKNTFRTSVTRRAREYGVSTDDVAKMFVQQEGRCPICEKALDFDDHRQMAIDHCHATGVVRGLLHHTCNAGIGMLRDDPDRCLRAAVYLSLATSERSVPGFQPPSLPGPA